MRRWRLLLALTAAGLALLAAGLGVAPGPAEAPAATARFAVIGDYGVNNGNESSVATLVASWAPNFALTVGDNNYPDGAASTIDANIGKHYHNFIFPYTGSYGEGASTNHFFPALGNHDWFTAGAQPYLDYFVLPGNERYYDFTWGPVHIFVIDSDPNEPDGIAVTSTQALWLQQALSASTEPWNLVAMHHPPYASGFHQSHEVMQWPYAAWGATAVLAGHDHHYERILQEGIVYFVNGSGGADLFPAGPPYWPLAPGSQMIYFAMHGAMLIDATPTSITFQFINRAGGLVDTYTVERSFVIDLPLVMASQN
jgi:tartrate-resistant acid phosphatase type 5